MTDLYRIFYKAPNMVVTSFKRASIGGRTVTGRMGDREICDGRYTTREKADQVAAFHNSKGHIFVRMEVQRGGKGKWKVVED